MYLINLHNIKKCLFLLIIARALIVRRLSFQYEEEGEEADDEVRPPHMAAWCRSGAQRCRGDSRGNPNLVLSVQEGEEEADEENDPDYDPKVSAPPLVG